MDDDKGVGGAVEKGFSTDLVTDKAIRWIKERDRTKPFSVFCHFKATHEPCDFPERFAHLYDGVRFPEPENLLEFGPAKSGRTFAGQPLVDLPSSLGRSRGAERDAVDDVDRIGHQAARQRTHGGDLTAICGQRVHKGRFARREGEEEARVGLGVAQHDALHVARRFVEERGHRGHVVGQRVRPVRPLRSSTSPARQR